MLANIGIPMIGVQWTLMLAALVPVIVVEALLIVRWLSLSYKEAFMGVGKANAISTAIGVPVAWGIMLAVEFVGMIPIQMAADHWNWKMDSPILQFLGFLLTVAWLTPMEVHLHWLIPTAVAVLLIPCFYVSVWLEKRSCLKSWDRCDPVLVRRAVYRANVASYALLFVGACVWIANSSATNAR